MSIDPDKLSSITITDLGLGQFYCHELDVTIVAARVGRDKHESQATVGGEVLGRWRPRRRSGPVLPLTAAQSVLADVVDSVCDSLRLVAMAVHPLRAFTHVRRGAETRCGITYTWNAGVTIGDPEDVTCPVCIADLYRIASVMAFLPPSERK